MNATATQTRCGNDFLEFPAGTDGTFSHARVACREIVLGEDTTNTCNIALADVDGDGLDEIATPLTLGEEDCVRLYRGDGTLIWENRDVQLYHAFYQDDTRPDAGMAHLWHRSKHRHVLTEIVDLDGDGESEVVVGDGPLWILDARSGAIKRVLDLQGRCALWNVVHDPKRDQNLLITTVNDRNLGPAVMALDASGDELWRLSTPGHVFCDCMHHGDLNLDGRPEIGFSIEEVKAFWVIDCDGALLWNKSVPRDLGDDAHVDDFLISQVLPPERMPGQQLLLVTGPNLLDQHGNIIWSLEDTYHHAQKVIAHDFHADRPGQEVYVVESFRRHAYMLDCDGERMWEYGNFTRARPEYAYQDPRLGQAVGRLTTAGDLIDWTGTGEPMIVQSEMGGIANHPHRTRRTPFPEGAEAETVRFMHVIDRHGAPVAIFPIHGDPMCARAAQVTPSAGQDIIMVGHRNSRIHIYTKKT